MTDTPKHFTLWNGDYVKEPYLALINGKAVPCWPNAGEMVACDGSGRAWKPEDSIQVRVCSHGEHIVAAYQQRAGSVEQ